MERRVVAALAAVIAFLWLGFFVHSSPSFPGSAFGVALGILAATAILAASAHGVLRSVPAARKALSGWVDMRRMVQAHVYIGALAAILALLHTGHKFQSTLGIVLTAVLLLIVLSGFAGRYLLGLIGDDEGELQQRLALLRAEYARVQAHLQADGGADLAGTRPMELAESLADTEYGIAARERLKRLLAGWMLFHLWTSITLLLLLGLHIWAALEFSLRWPW